jgi:hypothetical protein
MTPPQEDAGSCVSSTAVGGTGKAGTADDNGVSSAATVCAEPLLQLAPAAARRTLELRVPDYVETDVRQEGMAAGRSAGRFPIVPLF